MEYGIAHIIHLLCAIAFIGVVFFEVFIMSGIRDQVGPAMMPQIQAGIVGRAKKVMPWVVATLFISGVILAYIHYSRLPSPFSTSLGILLAIKILLAFSVLIHFISAIRATSNGCMTGARFDKIHLSVLTHMILIVVLAKAMFYVSW